MSDTVITWNPPMFQEAHRFLRTAPERLSEQHIEQLEIFSPQLAQQATEMRFKALHPAPLASVPATPPRLDVDAIAGAVIDVIAQAVAPLAARIDTLEKERGQGVGNVRWRGTFKPAEIYRSGELVTHDGSLWVVLRDTAQVPGRPKAGEVAAYQLIVKRGAVGRDD